MIIQEPETSIQIFKKLKLKNKVWKLVDVAFNNYMMLGKAYQENRNYLEALKYFIKMLHVIFYLFRLHGSWIKKYWK